VNAPFYSHVPNERDNDNYNEISSDNWQPLCLLVRRIVSRINRPAPTVVVMLEANRFEMVEAD
jgi:hypothetical protein